MAGSHIYQVKFDMAVTPGQHVPLSFRPTALRLVSPVATRPDQLIREGEPVPAEWVIEGVGRLIVHRFADDGFDVEFQPSTVVVRVEMEAYAPTTKP